jgi:formyl-CoA transferase
VFIHNNRPDAIDRLGLGYEAIKAVNPKIVYAFAHGYGKGGPYADKPAFDDLVQGISGAATLQSRVDGGPPRYMPALIADKTTGLHLAIAVLGALVHRERSGEGQCIEVPMFETLVSFWLTEHLFGETYDPPIGKMGYDRIINKYRHPFPTQDGFVCVLPYTDKHWAEFFRLVGRPDLASDDRFLLTEKRAQHYDELYQLLDTLMRGKTTAQWLPLLEAADIPVVPVRTLEELLEDPHLQAVGFYQEREHPSQGKIRTMRNPMRFSATPTQYRRHAPGLGEQGVEILREAGFPQDKIDALAKSGALLLPE